MKKVLSIIGAIVVILLFVFFIFFISDKAANKNFENISYSEYKELKGTTDMVVYIGEEDFIDSIKTIARENNINFKYLNYDKLSDKEKMYILLMNLL